MKNTFVNLLLALTGLFITSAFSSGPITPNDSLVKEIIVNASPLGGAFLVYAGKYGGEITKKEIAGQRELKVDGCAKGSRIFSFTLEVTKKGTKTTLQAKSNVLTDEMMSKLLSLTPGDTFEFKSMKAYMPNGKDIVDVRSEKFVVV
jgi:hypothetical protein